MSTDLYGVRVLERDGAKLKLQVFLVYYDWSDLPLSRTFFLRALWKPFGTEGPLPSAITVDEICDEAWVNENARRFIASARRLSTKNYPLSRAKDYATFYYCRDGKWQDEDKLVQGVYEVVMKEARWTEHLPVGLSWGTTAYETDEAPHILTPEEAGPIDFKGASVVLTGALAMPRADAKKALTAMGATIGSDLGLKTSYLIVGEKPGSKLKKAAARNIPILAEAVLAAAIKAAGSVAEVDHEAEKAKRSATEKAKKASKEAVDAKRPKVAPPAKGAPLKELPLATSEGDRELIAAVARRDLSTLTSLLEAGQSPNVATKQGGSALSQALAQRVSKKDNQKRLAVAKALLDAGADPNVVQPSCRAHAGIPIFLALTDFQLQRFVTPLIEAGASLGVVDPASGKSVLHLAAAAQRADLAERALEAGAPVEATDRDGNTALHALVAPTYLPLKGPVLTLLVEAGVEVNAKNKEGETAAHIAARYRGKTPLAALEKAGADLSARTASGATTLHYAAMCKKDSSLAKVDEVAALSWLLKNTKLDLEVVDDAGETLLHAAARRGSDSALKLLLDMGLSAGIKNAAGETPAEVCKRKKGAALLKAAEG